MVPSESPPPPNAEELISKFQLLHLVAEALSHISAADDPATVTPTIAKLHAKVKECDAVLEALPGGAMTRTEQLAEIDRLRDALLRKRELVRRYAHHDLVSRVLAQRAMPANSTAADPAAQQLPNDVAQPNASLPAQPAADVDPQKELQAAAAPSVSNDADAMRMDDSFGDGDYGFMGKM